MIIDIENTFCFDKMEFSHKSDKENVQKNILSKFTKEDFNNKIYKTIYWLLYFLNVENNKDYKTMLKKIEKR
jgi:hypothetical protein